MTTLVVLVAVVVVFAWAVVAYNGLVALRVRVRRSRLSLDALLRRRHDLAADLVETGQGNTGQGNTPQEREILDAVTRARADAIAAAESAAAEDGSAERVEAETQLSTALFDLRALVDRLTDSPSGDRLAQLDQELRDTERRIASAQESYNDALARYEARRRQLPTKLIAGLGDFPSADAFDFHSDSRTPVRAE